MGQPPQAGRRLGWLGGGRYWVEPQALPDGGLHGLLAGQRGRGGGWLVQLLVPLGYPGLLGGGAAAIEVALEQLVKFGFRHGWVGE